MKNINIPLAGNLLQKLWESGIYTNTPAPFDPYANIDPVKLEEQSKFTELKKGDVLVCIQDVFMNGVRRKLAYQEGKEYVVAAVYDDDWFRLPSLQSDCHDWDFLDKDLNIHFMKKS